MKYRIIVQQWEIIKKGQPVPDGSSFHLNHEQHKAFMDSYWRNIPKRIPARISRLKGKPRNIKVGDALFERIKSSRTGLRKIYILPRDFFWAYEPI